MAVANLFPCVVLLFRDGRNGSAARDSGRNSKFFYPQYPNIEI